MEITKKNTEIRVTQGNPSPEELLAIATALELYTHGGIAERTLTINQKQNSAWNSKLFGINQLKR